MKFKTHTARTPLAASIRAARLAILLSVASGGFAQTPDLRTLELEDLMNLRVTSVGKKEQALSRAGAAVFVITQEDIRRSGMRNIPDLLRIAPGVDVARIDAHSWAISIRGFNAQYSSKVLVLIDGRTVFTPTFSGVFWDQQNVPLEDIDRIEIIRGPGGTVWGANAVNGVINIITRSARETQGTVVTLATGSEESGQVSVQHGGSAGAKGAYRVYGRYFQVRDSASGDPGGAADGWHSSAAGFRSDWTLSHGNTLSVQGDFSGNSEGQTITAIFPDRLPGPYTFHDQVRTRNSNLLGRWNHTFANGSETTVQAYFDHERRLDLGALEALNTGDFDIQYHVHAGSRNDMVAGAGYRLTDDRVSGTLQFGTGHRRNNLYTAFVQDEVKLTNTLSLTVGSKLEHNAYTGFEYEPGAQLVWTPTERQTVWASVAKAIQQPSWHFAESRIDYATVPMNGGFGLVQLLGNPNAQAAQLFNFELGYRSQLSKRLSVDVNGFLAEHRRLQTLEPATPYFTLNPGPPHLVLPNVFDNLARGRNLGIEFSANLNVTSWWRIGPGYSYLRMKLRLDPSSHDTLLSTVADDSPRNQAQFRSTMNLPHQLEWDTSAYYVSPLGSPLVPAYTRLDTRLGWRVGEHVEVSIAGQNMLTAHHVEFRNAFQLQPTEVERSVSGRVTWRF